MRIVHVSDIHIKLGKGHVEQREVFRRLYEQCRELKPDIIVNTGDTFHSKLQLSPAAVDMGVDLFKNLVDIAPVYNLLGNHDFLISNKGKTDALSPIIKAIKNPNLKLIKQSSMFDIGDYRFSVLSLFDPENWARYYPHSDEKINVALFHGSVRGSKTDVGFEFEHGDIDLSALRQFDYALLGDIHKHQALDPDGRICYAGSLCQNNFGEENDKGFLFWDIADKKNFTAEHIHIPNPKPYVTVQLDETGIPINADHIPSGARLRLTSETNLSHIQIKRAKDAAKLRWQPESITYFNRKLYETSTKLETGNSSEFVDIGNLRDLKTQEVLIRDYLRDYSITDEQMEQVLKLNEKYTQLAASEDGLLSNARWRLKKLEWSNLMNYGEGNVINFEKLKGLVGIFGKNFVGKSSSIVALLYTLFNTTDRNERKNVNIINQNEVKGSGRAEIELDNNIFYINRESEKYEKKSHGQTTIEAKTKVEFNSISDEQAETNLNGESRNDTDKQIRNHIGTIEDFFMTSMMPQMNSLSFVEEGGTKKKELFARFFDLEIFDKKFKLGKARHGELRAFIRKYENVNFDKDIESAQTNLTETTERYEKTSQKLKDLRAQADENTNLLFKAEADIKTAYEANSNLPILQNKIKENRDLVTKLEKINQDLNKTIEGNKQKITKFNDFVAKNQETLDSRDAIEELNEEGLIRKTIREVLKSQFGGEDDSEHASMLLDPEKYAKAKKCIAQYDELKPQVEQMTADEPRLLAEISANIDQLDRIDTEITSDVALVQELEEKANIETLKKTQRDLQANKTKIQDTIKAVDGQILDLSRDRGSLEQNIKHYQDQKQEYNTLNEEFSSYDLFLSCMHPGGIPFEIIKKVIPALNSIIAEVLSSVVDFEIFFNEDGGKSLDIMIKHPQYDARPLAMGSGSEKMIASLAIRLALIRLSSIPLCQIFIMDEPATALDEEHLEGFTNMLSMLKEHFETVIIISHLDALKDSVDNVITIGKNENGSARIEVR